MVFAARAQQQRQMSDRIERLEKNARYRQVSEAKAILMRMHSIGEEQTMRFCAIRLWTNVLLSKRSHVR
jgi:AmiR/NasT family two-component response regulator